MNEARFQPPSLETALDTNADIARGEIERHGALAPTFLFTFAGVTMPIRVQGAGGDRERAFIAQFVRSVTLGFRPDAVAFIAQAWVSLQYDGATRPGDDPDRQEAVVVSVETPWASRQRLYPLEGSGNGMRMAQQPVREMDDMKGSLTGIYGDGTVTEQERADARARVEAQLDPAFLDYLRKHAGHAGLN